MPMSEAICKEMIISNLLCVVSLYTGKMASLTEWGKGRLMVNALFSRDPTMSICGHHLKTWKTFSEEDVHLL